MLDDREFELVQARYLECTEAAKEYRRQHDVDLHNTPLDEIFAPADLLILELTGSSEFHRDEVVRRHRVSRWRSKAGSQ